MWEANKKHTHTMNAKKRNNFSDEVLTFIGKKQRPPQAMTCATPHTRCVAFAHKEKRAAIHPEFEFITFYIM